jgi:predicted acetyltransferase
MSKAPQLESLTERMVKPDEIKKLDAYFKRVINPQAVVKARPRKNDSAEVYLGEEFLGVVYVDDEDGDRSYNFSMAILDVDL